MLLTEGDTGSLQKVDQLDLDECFKTLGIHKIISGHQGKQITEMKTKSDACARSILLVNVTNFEAWTGLFTIWYGQMNYPLAATSVPRPACEKIQSKAISASLSKCGFNQKTNRAIVHGNPWFGGLGWRHIYFEQGIQHILTIIKHRRTPGPFQILLQIALDWYQVTAGVSFSPLYLPSVPTKYIKCPWIDITCDMLLHCSAQLGRARMLCNDSEWSEQPRPQETVWGEWRKALSDAYCTNNIRYVLASQPGRLTQRLGSWLSDYTAQTSPRWRNRTLVQHSTQWMYHWNRPHDQYERLSTATRLEFGLATYTIPAIPILVCPEDIPADAVPAQPTNDGRYLRLNRLHTPDILATPPLAPPAQSFQDHLDTLPEWQQNLFAGLYLTTGHDSLGQHLLNGDRLFFCSDGGAKDNAGSFGWVIATATTLIWECSGIAAGWYANSFRSEDVGQLSLLVFLEVYIAYYRLKQNRGYASPQITTASFPASRLARRPSPRLLARHSAPNTTWSTRLSRSNAGSLSAFNGNMSWATKTRRRSGTN
jgi:hypothetical protein